MRMPLEFTEEKRCTEEGLKHVINEQCLSNFFKASLKIINFQPGETIWKQGTAPSQIIFLKRGLVKLLIESKNKKSLILNLYAGGDMIGLSNIYLTDMLPNTLKALKDSEVWIIDKEKFIKALKENIEVYNLCIGCLNSNYLDIHKRMVILNTRNSLGRVADALLFLSKGKYQKEGIDGYIGRKELAEFANVSIESINKIMKTLREDKVIDIHKNAIKIMDKNYLEYLSVNG